MANYYSNKEEFQGANTGGWISQNKKPDRFLECDVQTNLSLFATLSINMRKIHHGKYYCGGGIKN